MASFYAQQLVIIFLLVASLSGIVQAKEYCQPSDPCWPTSDELKSLTDSLKSNVITSASPQYHNASLINNRRFIEHPGMIVEVFSTDDVVLSLKFARDHNIRVSIVSTGHDYDGRNSGNNTLQLSFKTMKRKSIVEYGEKKIPAIRVETGNTWDEVHNYVKENMRSKVVIGGSDPSVGVAGWALGGGHSPFSSMAGLGVDNALAFDMVLANGSSITADGDQNTEVFWALRGGGGGTFGVVTNITFRLHDNPGPIVVLYERFPLDWKTGHPLLLAFGKWLSAASSKVSGYLQIVSNPLVPSGTYISVMNVYRGSYDDAMKEFKPLLNLPYKVKNISAYNDAYEYYAQIPPDFGGYSIYMFNSFLSDESLASGHSMSVAFSFVHSKPHNIFSVQTGRVCMGAILGGAVATAVESSGATAIHPGFRKARMSMTCGTAWIISGPYPHAETVVDDWASKFYKYGDGSYYNEPQSNLEDWKTEFWGSGETYNHLLKIKKEVDPEFLFNCHHCVGYED